MRITKPALWLMAALPMVVAGCINHSQTVPATGQAADTGPSRLFLQQVSSSSALIKWRGKADRVYAGTHIDQLDTLVKGVVTEGNHKQALLTGLKPDTRYYYSVGTANNAATGQSFLTAPATGSLPADGNIRMWLVGDSGTHGDDEAKKHAGEAAAVQAGMQHYIKTTNGEPIDLFVMLGDNAYSIGSDINYQQAVFDLYHDLLKTVALWPTIGNHEMGLGSVDACVYVPKLPCGLKTISAGGVSSSADPNSWIAEAGDKPTVVPYLDIFSLPTAGEVGGVASGTEQYYSFDYGNVHVVSLDSQLTARDESQRATMRQWLIDDLSANNSDWTVVIFHHPPYSKGANHDSDDAENSPVDRPQWDMRNEFIPIFDNHGVDLVYSGHSHSYERSYYLHNHTGTSNSYSHAQHAELVNGDPDMPASGQGSETYGQLSASSGGVDNRVVYTVAGNSGKADSKSGKLTTAEEWLRHPAHILQAADTIEPKRNGLAIIGSVIIDASRSRLEARMIDQHGAVKDHFTITR